MKQDDKRCERCLYWMPWDREQSPNGECRESPPIYIGDDRDGVPVFDCPTCWDNEWCGKGRWCDERGNLVGWTDGETVTGNGTLPHSIHWVELVDSDPSSKPISEDMGKERRYIVAAWTEHSEFGRRIYSFAAWHRVHQEFIHDLGDCAITHWAHITEPED